MEPKKQHYVPQFLLSKFAVGKKKRIHTFDLKMAKSFASQIRDVGHENNFYNHPEEGNQMEFQLGKLETKVAPIIDKIISEGSIKSLSKGDQKYLGIFTIVQMMRVNSIRESLVEMGELIVDKFVGDSVEPDSQADHLLTSFKELDVKTQSIDMLKETPLQLLPYILDKHISLVKAPKGEVFYISDNPIVKYNHQPREHRGNLGLRVKGVEVHLPISPKFCLSFLCSELVDDIRKAVNHHQAAVLMESTSPNGLAESISILNHIDNKITKELSSENMEYHNSLQVLHCSRFIYSSNSDFDLVNIMLSDNPNIGLNPRVVDGSNVF
ncbi:DUF4238 domain-containing protein [Psychromonas sp. Urea-02u-13]|uniref:DUF4238 domain-containing protein n=1 Tax=Psychromonas sp. Urea-02u-13 TaxID=2058326 RepID=UPI000C348E2D|nr:DUF4238 domain-containing protein [Psychromonas sp. Urea-02u-13]PKG37040.1 hypothetical protein CXF74_20965 [Psychromonas sp. Urea-02u-13]